MTHVHFVKEESHLTYIDPNLSFEIGNLENPNIISDPSVNRTSKPEDLHSLVLPFGDLQRKFRDTK